MFSWLLRLLGSGVIKDIGGQINEWQRTKLAAQNNADRIEADKQIAYLEGRRDVLVAEQGRWLTAWIRPAFAAIFILYDAKIVIWDKVLAAWTHGATDALPPEFWQLQMIVVGAYFLTRPTEKR